MKKYELSIIWSLIGLFVYLPVDAIIDPNVPAIFYPFGSDVGDSVAPVNDDGSTANIPISMGFPFFNSTNVNLYVNTNGVISFRNPCGTYTPDPFPVAYILISAYWCDVDTTRNNGRVYYRQSTDPELLNRATDDILPTYGPRGLGFFKAKWVFVATWHNVTFYGGGVSTPVNTFQAVMVTDSKYSFTMYNYGVMRWTTGTASGGNSSGLGGVPAQVGFNAGDNINYFAVPGSRTDSILDIGRDSNIGVTGRWLFRIDNAEIEMPGCQSSEPCRAYQSMDANSRACLDTAPAFGCPTIDGPLENADHVIEFFCKVPTNVTDTRALFGVTFLFDGEPDPRMPVVVIHARDAKAAMHEMFLAGKMGKWVGCSVRSYWDYATQNKSRALTSTNSFWAGVKTTKDIITVEERSQALPSLLLQSALPIVCTPVGNGHQECELHFNLGLVDGSQDILLGKQNPKKCTYLIKGSDWKADEKLAYDDNSPLRFAARQDAFQTSARFSMVSFKVDDLPRRTAGGQTFANIWSNYSLPSVWVYRYDQGGATCTSTGDPNLKTFDSLRYSIYNSGQFIYSQSTFGIPFEVHVRHNQCTSGSLSCVCGVAMREDDLILAADMCGPDKRVHYLTCNTSSIQGGAGITTSSMGNSFRIQLPSGNKVVGYVNGWGMTIEVYVMASDRGRTEGLCGSYDNNPSNDIKEKGTSNFYPISGGVAPAAVLRSWQIPTGQSLFDCHRSNLPTGGVGSDLKGAFCTCNNGGQNCGVGLHDTASDLWEPTQTVVPNVPVSTYDNNDVINDNIDYDYDSGSFNFTDPIRDEDNVWNFTWPTWNGITYAQAYQHCYSTLWIDSPIQQDCSSFVPDEDVQGIVNECVNDIKATGDLTWVNDKISEIQLECINRIVSYPNDDNDTAMAIGAALASVQTVLQHICVPSDCSGHGSCTNGTCQCQSGYIGSDCSVSVSSVPSIVRVLDPVICDVRQRRCQSLQMITSEMSDQPNPTCKIQVTKLGDSNMETYLTRAWITSPTTSTCDLPTELLQGFSNNVNFTEAAIQAGARNFSLISPGNPVMTYQVSMSNNGVTFSEPVIITVVDSLCYSCSDDDRCSRLPGTCSINGYCFVDGDVSPYRLCDLCKTSVSEISWSTIWGLPCYLDPCQSSPCPANMTCSVVSETEFECTENDTIPSGHCTDQESRNGFVCDDKNPCTEANLNNGCYTFPSIDPSKYVQCGGVNQCSVASCDPGFIWSRVEKVCVLDGSI